MADNLSDYAAYPALGYLGLRTALPFLKMATGPVGAFTSTLMNPTTANAGEQDLYKKDGTPNLSNPAFKLDMSQFLPPGYKPPAGGSSQGYDEAGFNFAPPSAPPSAGASPAAASASPSPSPGLPAPQAPAGAGGAGGFNPPLPAAFSRALPSFYNGPGSMSFGATETAPGLFDLFKGGTSASNAVQRAPDKLGWNALRFLTNNGQSFAPGWSASNAWYNN